MMRYYVALGLLVLLYQASFSQNLLVFEDKIYDSNIKTVQLFPDRGGPGDPLFPAAAPITALNLALEFDDLLATRSNYYAALIHCTYDWNKSTLMDLDFLREYNEFPLNDYVFSDGTQVPYIHYRFPIPTVRVPGNYLIMIYRDGDKTDLLLTRRFVVYMNTMTLTQDNQLSGTGTLKQTNQQINFTIDYSGIDIMNPLESVHVVLRQNQRWDNAKADIKPTFVRDGDSQLEYHFFDQDKFFNGGNEFRWVDFRSLISPGQNTGQLIRTVKPFHLFVQVDQPRTDQSYAQYNDQNGNYRVEDLDNGEPKTSANYLPVTFTLTAKQLNDPIYVIGAFNNWQKAEENKMQFDAGKAQYTATMMLKQGIYDYEYWVQSSTLPGNYLEGNHFETENVYEILIYNHTFQPNADQLLGYYVIQVNPR